jgi:hypothetical protein
MSDASLFASSFEEYKAGGKSISVKVFKANVLTPGASYMFTLNVDDGSKVGSSTMVVTVRSGPTSGDFEVEPTTLKQLEDVTLRGKPSDTVLPSLVHSLQLIRPRRVKQSAHSNHSMQSITVLLEYIYSFIL